MNGHIKMKQSAFFATLFLCIPFLLPPFLPSKTPPRENTKKFWWEAKFNISVSGTYQYTKKNDAYQGAYTFNTILAAAMELDTDNDFIVYGGDQKTAVIKWTETPLKNKENTPPKDLSEKIIPTIILNYALTENNDLIFDFELIIPEHQIKNRQKHLGKILLPRSELNQNMHPKDKYNKHVKKGSNKIQIPEKIVLNQQEIEKSFSWSWEKKKKNNTSAHTVNIILTFTKKIGK